uniref:Guanine nucleotide-binding protein alpha subunit n=1 Tax=Oryza sativa subsp. japonica TaxID=39947 RepID=Q5WMU1_ORYSJ|nr:hypothetical protein [Oryza sativa Japonica Group]
MSVLTYVLDNIGSSCSRSHSLSEAETAENAKIKLLFQTGFDEAELRSYTSVIHANVYQTIKILYEGAKELSQVESDSSKYVISPDNQETYLRGSILQLPDCAQYFMENLDRLAEADYVPTKGLKFNIREEKLLFYHYYAVYITKLEGPLSIEPSRKEGEFCVHQLVKIVPQDHDSDELWSAIRGDDCVEYGYVHPECRRQ